MSIPFLLAPTSTAIVKAIEQTDIVLVLIGPNWLSVKDGKGQRLANSADPVRIEIETAFNKGLLVVPVLIGEASMPEEKDLPRSLRKLVDLNAAKLRPDPDFNKDVARLAQELKLPEPSSGSAPNKVKSLHVTCSALENKNLLFRYTLLSGSPEAIVPSTEKLVHPEALAAVFQRHRPYAGEGPSFQALEGFGDELADLLLPGTLHDLLGQEPDVYLIIFHDRAAGQIPWELIRIDRAFPALRAGLSRRLLCERPGGGTTRPLGSAARANVLILANPTEDLPETEREAQELAIAIKGRYAEAVVTLFQGQEATKERFRSGITSGKYDLIHFAGHGDYDALDPGKSGIYFAGLEVFSSLDLDKPISRPPGFALPFCGRGRSDFR